MSGIFADKMRSFYNQVNSSSPTSVYAQYLYDAAGNRVKKIVRSGGSGIFSTAIYIDGIIEYHHDESSGGPFNKSYSYVMDNKKIIAEIKEGDDIGDHVPTIKYHIDDHLGSCSARLDTNGTYIDSEEYYPFGETSFGSYAKKRYRFCAKEKDEESGLYYYGARYYSAWTCKFISTDPLAGEYMYLSPYNYAGNKPTISIDLDGMQGTGNKSDAPASSGGGASTAPDPNNSEKVIIHSNQQGNRSYITVTIISRKTIENKVLVTRSTSTYAYENGKFLYESKPDAYQHWEAIQETHSDAKAESPQLNAVSGNTSNSPTQSVKPKSSSHRINSSNTEKKRASPSSNNNSPRFQWSPGKPSSEQPSNTGKSNGDGGHDNHLVDEIKEGMHLAADAVKDASEDALEHPMKYGYKGMEKIEEIAKKILGRINIVASVFKYALGGIDLIKSFYELVKSAFTTGIVKMSQVANVIIGAIKTFGGFAANFALSIFEGTPAFKKTMEFLDKTVYNFGTGSFMLTR